MPQGQLLELPECTCSRFVHEDGQIYHFDPCPVAKLNWSHPEHKKIEMVPPSEETSEDFDFLK